MAKTKKAPANQTKARKGNLTGPSKSRRKRVLSGKKKNKKTKDDSPEIIFDSKVGNTDALFVAETEVLPPAAEPLPAVIQPIQPEPEFMPETQPEVKPLPEEPTALQSLWQKIVKYFLK